MLLAVPATARERNESGGPSHQTVSLRPAASFMCGGKDGSSSLAGIVLVRFGVSGFWKNCEATRATAATTRMTATSTNRVQARPARGVGGSSLMIQPRECEQNR